MKNTLLFIWEVIKIIFIAILIVAPIRYFIFQPFIVQGGSMEPNFQHNNYLIVDQLSYRFREPKRGEVIVFNSPEGIEQYFIKRIIGLPGEIIQIENGQVTVSNNQNKVILDEAFLPEDTQTPGSVKSILKENEFFVLGDNRIASSDSRYWGPLHREDIIGRVFLRAWPFIIFEAPEFIKVNI